MNAQYIIVKVFPGCSDGKASAYNSENTGSIPVLGQLNI